MGAATTTTTPAAATVGASVTVSIYTYKLYTDKKTWAAATTACQTAGGDLATFYK